MNDYAGKPGGLPGRLVDALSRQQDEMSRVARVLHEDIGQVLTVVGLHLDVLRQDYSEKAPEIAENTKHIQKLLEKAIEDVRQLSYKLNSDIVQRSGLRYALDTLIGRLRESSTATIRLLMDSRIHLPITVATAVYEIADQAVGNAVKHSQAELIEVVLQPVQEGVRFEIRDNGVGFDTAKTKADARGIGLIWMQHIAAKAGMKFHVVSRPGKGTTIQASYRADEEARREAAESTTHQPELPAGR